MMGMNIAYAFILQGDEFYTWQETMPRPRLTLVEAPILHRDWYGKPCGGEFTYAHRHSVFNHIGWWMCGLCSRKVCGYQPDPLIAAAQKAVST